VFGIEGVGYSTLCISPFVLLDWISQAGVIGPVATGPMTVRVRTIALSLRWCVRRPEARSARALCPKLEPLLEHDNHPFIVARISQV